MGIMFWTKGSFFPTPTTRICTCLKFPWLRIFFFSFHFGSLLLLIFLWSLGGGLAVQTDVMRVEFSRAGCFPPESERRRCTVKAFHCVCVEICQHLWDSPLLLTVKDEQRNMFICEYSASLNQTALRCIIDIIIIFFVIFLFSFGKRSAGSLRRGCECIVLEPSEMIVVSLFLCFLNSCSEQTSFVVMKSVKSDLFSKINKHRKRKCGRCFFFLTLFALSFLYCMLSCHYVHFPSMYPSYVPSFLLPSFLPDFPAYLFPFIYSLWPLFLLPSFLLSSISDFFLLAFFLLCVIPSFLTCVPFLSSIISVSFLILIDFILWLLPFSFILLSFHFYVLLLFCPPFIPSIFSSFFLFFFICFCPSLITSFINFILLFTFFVSCFHLSAFASFLPSALPIPYLSLSSYCSL